MRSQRRPVLGTLTFPGLGRDGLRRRRRSSWPRRTDRSWCWPSSDPQRLAAWQDWSLGVDRHVIGLTVRGLGCGQSPPEDDPHPGQPRKAVWPVQEPVDCQGDGHTEGPLWPLTSSQPAREGPGGPDPVPTLLYTPHTAMPVSPSLGGPWEVVTPDRNVQGCPGCGVPQRGSRGP